MARFAFDGRFIPTDARARLRPLQDTTKDLARHRHQVVVVPAGKSRLVVLDDKPNAASNYAQFLQLHSTVEGVQWWPIDSATPSVDVDTRPFGPLLDMTAPDFEHSHGHGSHIGSDHNVNGSPVFYSTLPCFQNCANDRTIRTGDDGWFSTDTETPDGKVVSDGHARDDSTSSGSSANIRILHYLIGQDNYYNLGSDPTTGSDHADGLEFYPIIYVEDPSKLSRVRLRFYCWPFTRTMLDAVAGANSSGDTVWGTSDRFLCRASLASDAISGVGWDRSNLISGAYFELEILSADLVAGTSTYRLTKADATEHLAGTLAFDDDGSPTFSRITMISFEAVSAHSGDSTTVELVNILFRPRPGLMRRLRPGEQTTDQPWSTNSLQAIGLYNPSGIDATVSVAFGGL